MVVLVIFIVFHIYNHTVDGIQYTHKLIRKGWTVKYYRRNVFVESGISPFVIIIEATLSLNMDEEIIHRLKICWIRFKTDEPLKIFYKTSMKENVPFKVTFLFGKQGKPKHLSKITMFPLYKT